MNVNASNAGESRLNWHNAKIHASYGRYAQIAKVLPHNPAIAEIAFAGRSNVGKSSLINKLLNRKSIARVSSRPGKTVTINFFDIDGKIYIVDLPGYGYARIAQTEKERFGALTERYLQSGRIAFVAQLIDFRHAPTRDDLAMFGFLEHYKIPYAAVLTKADKLKKTQRENMRREIETAIAGVVGSAQSLKAISENPLSATFGENSSKGVSGGCLKIIEFSSETGEGVPELRACIEEVREKSLKIGGGNSAGIGGGVNNE